MSGSSVDIESISKALMNDLILISRILLKGKILISRKFSSGDEVISNVVNMCSDSACYLSVRVGSEAIFKAFIVNGEVVGCSLERSREVIYGRRALTSFRESKGELIATLYSFNKSMLERSLSMFSVQLPKAKKEISRIALNPKDAIMKNLSKLGAPVTDVGIVDGREYVVIDVICDSSKALPSFRDLIFATIGAYVDSLSKVGKKVKVTIHHRKTYSESYDVRGNERMWRAIGNIPLILWKHGLYIDRLRYSVKGGVLEVHLTLKRYDIYSTASIDQVAKEIYEALRKVWGGAVVVRAKIGTLGLEARVP